MSDVPERLWAWHWHSHWDANPPESGPLAIAQSGYCRPNDRYPLDKRERESGADYTRTDLIAAIVEKAVQAEREKIADLLEIIFAASDGIELRLGGTSETITLREIVATIRTWKGGAA